MPDIFRDAIFGQFIRLLNRSGNVNKFLTYADERADFVRAGSPEHASADSTGTPPPDNGGSEKDSSSNEDAEKQSLGLMQAGAGDLGDIVDWGGAQDPDNPQNWSQGKKAFVFAQIVLMTFSGARAFPGPWLRREHVSELVEN